VILSKVPDLCNLRIVGGTGRPILGQGLLGLLR